MLHAILIEQRLMRHGTGVVDRGRDALGHHRGAEGVAQSAAEEATADISDEEAAYDATRRRMKGLRGLEYARFRERLGSFLNRRGFGYDVVRGVIERCWAELGEEEAGETAN